jgi:hypothetical protein
MRYFKLIKTEKISGVTIFKNQYFPNNKNHPLMVLREDASDSLLPVYHTVTSR